jgi:zinc transport system permease protein
MLEFLDLPQMQRALLIALLIGPVAGLLGTFVTLRRLSFFSDAVSHASMTGVTLGFLLSLARDINSPAMQIVLVVFCVGIALLMAWLFESTTLHTDTVIAFSYSGSVALGVIFISKLRGRRVLEGALFGDILSASRVDLLVIAALVLLTLVFLVLNLRALTLSAVQENLARIEGFNTRRLNYGFVVLLALVVAILLRQLGALLISGLLVVPAAAARTIALDFRKMLVLSAVFGLTGAVSGVVASYYLNSPTGPTMVLADVLILSVCLGASRLR